MLALAAVTFALRHKWLFARRVLVRLLGSDWVECSFCLGGTVGGIASLVGVALYFRGTLLESGLSCLVWVFCVAGFSLMLDAWTEPSNGAP
jgi:hypothetical protein